MKPSKSATAPMQTADTKSAELAKDGAHDHLPPPTFWPAGLALGVTLIFWSLITSWVVLVMGGWLFIISLAGWVRDIRHERKTHS